MNPTLRRGTVEDAAALDNLAKVILLTSFIISYAYCVESFMTWYSQDPIEMMTSTCATSGHGDGCSG